MVGGDLDAILVKPRETITISALEITAETPGTHQHDVFNEQGLWNFPTGPAGLTGMWFLKNVTSSAGFANVGNLNNAFVHIPVWMTGTTFICIGTNQVMLPHNPPIGTQYSFLVKDGTTNLDRPTLGGSEAHMASSFAASSGQDEFYELFEENLKGYFKPNSIGGMCANEYSYHAVNPINIDESRKRKSVRLCLELNKPYPLSIQLTNKIKSYINKIT